MTDRRGLQFVLEIVFLAALAAALAFAHLDSLEIVGGMLAGWLVVAALEWASWRSRPHYGSGIPPRYYVPSVNLPPAQPLEQVAAGYPEAAHDEAPTWIASAELRAEVLGEWPVAVPAAEPEPAPEAEPEQEEEAAAEEPAFVSTEVAGADPWTVAALPAEPEPEPPTRPEPEPEPEPEPGPEPQSLREPGPVLEGPTALYHPDPLAEPAPKRRFRRQAAPETEPIVVPARPLRPRALPGAASRPER